MELETVNYLEHHATILRTRRKGAVRSAVLTGALFLFLAVAQWLIITESTYDYHDLTYDPLMGLALTVVLFIMVVTNTVMMYGVRKETLELIDAIRRATGENSSGK
jgi:hypothetical protein